MRGLQNIALAALLGLCFMTTAFADDAKRIDDPEAFANNLMQKLAQGRHDEVTKLIIDATGMPSQTEMIKNALGLFNGKRFDFSGQVIDNQYGNSLRQIVHYSFIEGVGFVYFRFNLKMTSKGWVLANFNFKNETTELFPKDFVDRY